MLWAEAVAAFERGAPQLDPYLPDKARDLRRGVTLALRPSLPVWGEVAKFVGRLESLCPGQYFYRPEELHVTVLSIISGTEHWRREMDRMEACRGIIGRVLMAHRPFKIVFRGVTASPVAVMVQGFPVGESPAAIRTDLREAFASNGLGDMLDRRYKISAAHMTIMRFQKAAGDLTSLLNFLGENRQTLFGESAVQTIQLNFGDWYASKDVVKTLEEYRLARAPGITT